MDCLDPGQLHVIAAELYEAERCARAVPPLTERFADFDVGKAYAVQKRLLEAKLSDGGRLAGYKVGLTNKAVQDLLGADEPNYGFVLDRMVLPPGDEIPCSLLIQPRRGG